MGTSPAPKARFVRSRRSRRAIGAIAIGVAALVGGLALRDGAEPSEIEA